MQSTRRTILALFSAFVLPLAAADMTTLTVHVTGESGKPVDHASVVVKFVQGRSKVKFGKKIRTEFELHTNEDGIAKIPPIPQGTILVQIIAKDYQTFGDNFDVNEPEKTIDIKLNPPQPQYSAH
ncbi:MAG TPA: carboxypeptidase-like regulatory domain-containing protein [Bryobacteraceae bacterium]|nr:carboxypeptidase-like regulatory domain-containing protein [Bryobacteraceae bacterium]